MDNLTADKIDADLNNLLEGFSSGKRHIPSPLTLLRLSLAIPVITVCLSLVSVLVIYLSDKYIEYTFSGYFSYLVSEGWIVVLPTIVIGVFFLLMVYNNLTMYMSVPKDIRDKSVVISHLKCVAKRTTAVFLTLMLLAGFFSGSYSRAAFAIPLLELLMFFGLNMVVGSEINRLGAGMALEKISNLIKKI